MSKKAYTFIGSQNVTSVRSNTTRKFFFQRPTTDLTGEAFENWYKAEEIKNSAIVESVCKRRSVLSGPERPLKGISTYKGRLLVYSPFYETGDGLASADSEGFYDEMDCPPWDTFVLYVPAEEKGEFDPKLTVDSSPKIEGVICWIPEKFLQLANAGVQCNPCGSLFWLDATFA